MKKYILFPHGGSGNHGCEAIVRTTVELLKDKEIVLFSNNPDEDRVYLNDMDIRVECPFYNASHSSRGYLKAFYRTHIKMEKDAFDALYFSPVISNCDKDTVLLSIGGDNYCYGDNRYIYLVNRQVRKKGAKTILWGCSVDPSQITPEMREDLAGYDLIVARESLTFKGLNPINSNTILLPDPAFMLQTEPGNYPAHMREKPYVGINISPMILGKEEVNGITLSAYRNLIDWIINNTENNIALIPHVVWEHSDDRKAISELYKGYENNGRVFVIEDQNCMQLKDIISHSSIFIGARTHATIAAYSSCVPTLVIGYSIKAKGIAIDLLGTDNHYVLPVQNLKSEDELTNAFKWIDYNAGTIKSDLLEKMPKYKECAKQLSRVVLLNEE